jgi:hypothetical protein
MQKTLQACAWLGQGHRRDHALQSTHLKINPTEYDVRVYWRMLNLYSLELLNKVLARSSGTHPIQMSEQKKTKMTYKASMRSLAAGLSKMKDVSDRSRIDSRVKPP